MPHTGLQTFRWAITAVALSSALALAGCTASGSPSPARSTGTGPEPAVSAAQPSPSPSAGTSAEPDTSAVTDAARCEAISDVMTIRFNVETAVREGRMGPQERDGWYRLATRDLQRIPTQSTSLISQQVAAIQATIPHTDPGALTSPVVGTDAWDAAAPQLSQLCAAAGAQIILQGFTGG